MDSSGQRGQASVEFIAVVSLVAIVFAAAITFVPVVDGRPLGAAIARALVCAVKRDCAAEGVALRHAYGDRDAQLVRANAPSIVYEHGTLTLPIDYRRCRAHRCSDAPDDHDLDATRAAHGGAPATAFTHVVHRSGATYIQYWFYYPDSPSTFFHSHGLLKTLHIHDPGFHPDDWEGYQVRIDAHGRKSVRATKHGGYTWCKGHIWHNDCERWGRPNGWTRVSRGSHAGHIPDMTEGNGLHERITAAPGLHLVPLETLPHESYTPLKGGIKPPWTKEVYSDPTSRHS